MSSEDLLGSELLSRTGRHQTGYVLLRLLPLGSTATGTVVLAIVLPIGQFGLLAVATGFSQIVVAISLFGQEQLIMQRRIAWRVGRNRAGLVVCSSAIGALAVGFMQTGLLLLIGSTVLSTAILQWLLFPYTAIQTAGHDLARAWLEASARVAYQASLVVGAAFSASAIGAAYSGLAAAGVSSIFVYSIAKAQSTQPSIKITAKFREGLVFGFEGLAFTLTVLIPTLTVAMFYSAELNAQVRVLNLTYGATAAVGLAIFGEYFRSRLYRSQTETERRLLWCQMKRALLFVTPLSIIAIFLGGFLVLIVVGSEYRPAVEALRILCLGTFPLLATAMVSAALIARGHVRLVLRRHLVSAAVAVVLCLTISMTPTTYTLVIVLNDFVGLTALLMSRSKIHA